MSKTIITKRCCKCKEVKPISEFYGRQNECKICCKIRVRLYALNNPEKCKLYKRRYHQSKKGKFKCKQYQQSEKFKIANKGYQKKYNQSEKGICNRTKYRHRNPERLRARSATNKAVKKRKLSKATQYKCTYCPLIATEYHHPSYTWENRLEVIPICFQCHRILHQKNEHKDKQVRCLQNSA